MSTKKDKDKDEEVREYLTELWWEEHKSTTRKLKTCGLAKAQVD